MSAKYHNLYIIIHIIHHHHLSNRCHTSIYCIGTVLMSDDLNWALRIVQSGVRIYFYAFDNLFQSNWVVPGPRCYFKLCKNVSIMQSLLCEVCMHVNWHISKNWSKDCVYLTGLLLAWCMLALVPYFDRFVQLWLSAGDTEPVICPLDLILIMLLHKTKNLLTNMRASVLHINI